MARVATETDGWGYAYTVLAFMLLTMIVVIPLTPLVPTRAASRVCQPLSDDLISKNVIAYVKGYSQPNFNEQLVLGFFDSTAKLSYNVTAVEQTDQYGYGPAYFINGLSDSLVWYQVGIEWNFGNFGPGVDRFGLIYGVWNATTYEPIVPLTVLPFSPAEMRDADRVNVSLGFKDNSVIMSAYDWTTKARLSVTYGALGSSSFLGLDPNYYKTPTSIMTEWYHVYPYSCGDRPVVYSNTKDRIYYYWTRTDEFNLTGVARTDWLSCGPRCTVFSTYPQAFELYLDSKHVISYLSATAILSANSTHFITP